MKCGILRVDGAMLAQKDMEAEWFFIIGRVDIGGLLNEEEIEITLNGFSPNHITEIGCERIFVCAK